MLATKNIKVRTKQPHEHWKRKCYASEIVHHLVTKMSRRDDAPARALACWGEERPDADVPVQELSAINDALEKIGPRRRTQFRVLCDSAAAVYVLEKGYSRAAVLASHPHE
jgi:hypothetical protein